MEFYPVDWIRNFQKGGVSEGAAREPAASPFLSKGWLSQTSDRCKKKVMEHTRSEPISIVLFPGLIHWMIQYSCLNVFKSKEFAVQEMHVCQNWLPGTARKCCKFADAVWSWTKVPVQVEVEGIQGLSELLEHITVWVPIFGKHRSRLHGIIHWAVSNSGKRHGRQSERLLLVRKSQWPHGKSMMVAVLGWWLVGNHQNHRDSNLRQGSKLEARLLSSEHGWVIRDTLWRPSALAPPPFHVQRVFWLSMMVEAFLALTQSIN